MSAIDVLQFLGFEEESTDEFQKLSDDLGLSKQDTIDPDEPIAMPHKVLAVLTKGSITALIEKNTSQDVASGMDTIVRHPAVLILESPHGRVCIPNHDDPANSDLIAAVVADLSDKTLA
jgi:hypothetical protein